MSTITSSETLQAKVSGGIIRYLFQYTLSNGEVHRRRAWVPAATDEAAERTSRGEVMLVEVAEAEANRLLGGNNG